MRRLGIAVTCAALVGLLVGSPFASAAPAKAATEPAKGQYSSEAEAKASCPTDAVVWVNLQSKIYHVASSKTYGKTKRGAYMCQQDSIAGGFRAPKAPARKSSAA